MTLLASLLLLLAISHDTGAATSMGTLRSVNAGVTGSSQHPSAAFLLSHAVDGSTRTDSSHCNCCAATINQYQPWIQVDLGRLYRVSTVEVIGRSDWTDAFAGMNIYAHTYTNWANNFVKKATIPSVTAQYYNATFGNPAIAQYVTLQLPNTALLCVCEVKIYSKDCDEGKYGAFCNDVCGNCQVGETCDHVTGACARCRPGYQRNICKENCVTGTYGLDCNSICHCHENVTCNHVTGECPDGRCDLGWQGSDCSEECKPGTYGGNCNHTCGHCLNNAPCDKRTGHCDSCASGYTGQLCTEECQEGTFGFSCASTCHCHNNQTCNHVIGACPDDRCDQGWHGSDCSQECEKGTYGENCKFTCGQCYNNVSCDRRTGFCEDCSSGFTGDKCVKECSPGAYGVNCNETCGQCLEDEVCDRVTGYCALCDAGYWGDICKNECTTDTFGFNCSSMCHCHGNQTCDHVRGYCPEGFCEIGWQGDTCSDECSIGTHGSECEEICGHCRDDEVCHHAAGNCTACEDGYIGRLCKDRCSAGRFGFECLSTCHCRRNQTCDHVSGECPDGQCDLGWQGDICSIGCAPGTYGGNCVNVCGHCYQNESCDTRSGACSSCSIGYTGTRCTEDCPAGTFGLGCSSVCHCNRNQSCDHISGECPQGQCDLGWHGDNCSIACEPGTYGGNCRNVCGHCFQNESCDSRSGVCDSCAAGYYGTLCTEACKAGTFGRDCDTACGHCIGSCNFMTGICPRGCLPEHQGLFCNESYNIMQDSSVAVSMSSIHQGLDATKAIDGVYVNDPVKCGCCSETLNGYVSWWQADFGMAKFIKQIDIYGRKHEDTHRHLVGFQVLTSISGAFGGEPVYRHNTTLRNNAISVTLPDVAAKYIRIERPGVLTLCEIEIFQSDIKCPLNTYGSVCARCGYCKDGSCDRVTGQCPVGCDDEHEGDLCMSTTTVTTSSVKAGIIGGAVGIGTSILVVLVVILVVCLRRHRKGKHPFDEHRFKWNTATENVEYMSHENPLHQPDSNMEREKDTVNDI